MQIILLIQQQEQSYPRFIYLPLELVILNEHQRRDPLDPIHPHLRATKLMSADRAPSWSGKLNKDGHDGVEPLNSPIYSLAAISAFGRSQFHLKFWER